MPKSRSVDTGRRLVVLVALLAATLPAAPPAAVVQVAETCLRTAGYWRTHPAEWPLTTLVLGSAANVNHTYSQADALTLLRLSTRNDASLNLAAQLIAAKLNVARGASPAPIAAALARADALLGAFAGRLPYGIAPRSPLGADMIATAEELDAYNNGQVAGVCGTANRAPSANAGPDQTVAVGRIVTLDGSASSDPDGDVLTFRWQLVGQPTGSAAALSDPAAALPTFVADRHGTYEIALVVNDGVLDSPSDTVRVSTINSTPTADAGPDQTRPVGSLVQLDGSGSSDPDGDALTFAWALVSRPAASQAALSDPWQVDPALTIDVAGTYEIDLIVSDGFASSLADRVVISTSNSAPVAIAGAGTTAHVGELVTLDGSPSFDVDGDALSFNWALVSRPAGSAAVLSDLGAVQPSFVVDRPGEYIAQLEVHDGTVASEPDTVVVSTRNSRPVAHAGQDQAILVGAEVMLDGSSSSDVDGDALTYTWSLTSKPADSTAQLSDPSAVAPVFLPDVAGTYIAQLIVHDGLLDSEPDTVTLTTGNRAPVAEAGSDQTVAPGATAQLDGTGSFDPDGDPLTFTWSLLASPAGSAAALSDPAGPTPTFLVDARGSYVAQLLVSDGSLSSAPSTVTISTENSRPTADAGSNQTVETGVTVQLDGRASSDPDGTPLLYAWSLLSRPAGSAAVISATDAAMPTFVADVDGLYVVQLIVGDGVLLSEADTASINAASDADVAIQFVNPPAGTIVPGVGVAFAVRVSNFGPLGTEDVSAAMALPAGLTLVAVTATAGAYDPVTGSWTIGALGAGEDAELSVQATVNASGSLALAASITNSSRTDPDLANNVANAAAANRPPSASAGADRQVTAGATAVLDGSASVDPDGDLLTFQWTLTSRPAGSTATLSNAGTATPSFRADVAGPFVAELVVTDLSGASATDSVMVTAAANRPPIITSSPVTTGRAGESYAYAVTALDPDLDDALTFSLPIAPAGMTIDSASGLVQWTPLGHQTGVNHVAVHVRDRAGLLAAQGFSIDVGTGEGNGPPEATDDEYDARTGDSLSVGAPGVLGNDSDPDGNRLTARALGQPDNGNLVFNRDGSFAYTPFTFTEGELVIADIVNLSTAVAGVTVTATSELSQLTNPSGAARNVVDGSAGTQWRSHHTDSPALGLRSLTGGPPFVEVAFPEAVDVHRLQVVGARQSFFLSQRVTAGIFKLFDGDGAELYDSGVIDLPLPDRDGGVSVPDLFTRSQNAARTVDGVTYSASGSRAGLGPERAFDGNLRTEWVSPFNQPGPQFLEVSFPADVPVYRVNIFGNRSAINNDFLAFEVQLFDAAGTLVFSSGTTSVPAESSDVSVAVGGLPGRRVRVIGTQQQSLNQGGGISELEVVTTETVVTPLNDTVRRARFIATAGNPAGGETVLAEFRVIGTALMRREGRVEPNLPYRLPTIATASSFSSGNAPGNAIDATVRNWYAVTGGAGEFLELEFPYPATVRELQALNASATPGGFGSSIGLNCAGSFLLIGDDGGTLFDSGVVPTPNGILANPTPFTITVPEISGVRRIRYVSAGCVSGSQPTGFAEVRVLGTADVVTPPISMATKFHALVGREVHTTPLVVNLTDDNGDGRIDEHDVPDIVVVAEQTTNQLAGEIKVISGDDGRELFTAGAPDMVSPWAEPAAADLDGDGRPEIVALHSNGSHLITFDHTGQVKWISDAHAMPRFAQDTRFVAGAIAIANLDSTGPPEIIVGASVFDAEGRLLADGRTLKGTTGGTNLRSAISAVADIDLDGTPELVAGPTAYRFAGGALSIAWQRTDRGDGYSAIANLDDDPFAEIVYVANGVVYVLNHDGSNAPLWNPPSNAPVPIPGGGMGGAPTVADVDGDGVPEIGVAGAGYYVVFNRDGSVRWQAPVSDRTSNSTGATVFDLDGDGSVEVIYRDELHLRIYRGSDGVLLQKIEMGSSTWAEMPVVADVDNDGHADLVVTSDRFLDGNAFHHTGVYVFQDVANRWVRTRRIWNQHSYHVTNINEDGSVPIEEQPHFLVPALNSFRLNRLVQELGDDNTDAFTYVASDGELESSPATVRIAVRTPNSAPRIVSTAVPDAASGVPYFYSAQALDPDAGDILTFSLPTAPVGMSIDPGTGLVVWTPDDTQQGSHQVVVKVQDLRGHYALQGYAVQVAAPVTVPDVVGTVQSAAASAIVTATLTVGAVSARHSPTAAVDTVMTQTPPAGTLVAPRATVDLLVSLGPAPAGTVPEVVGMRQIAAQVDITTAGFAVGTVNGVHNATVAAGTVLGQQPAGGTQADLGSPVALTVSLGVPPGQLDVDGDGFTGDEGDCNDTDPSIRPGAFDIPGDGIDQNCNGVDSVAGDVLAPVAALESPADLAEVTMPTDIVGTATDANFLRYTLTLAEVDATEATTIGSGTVAVTSGVLGRIDPTLLENGLYRVRLVVEDVNGQLAVDERVYRVDGMMKVGNFRLSFTDLSVPVAGIPITIVRTYDSRVKTKEDFGIGWTLDIKRGSYRHNRPPGRGWIIKDQPFLGQFLPCIGGTLETLSHLTEVRLSDRESYKFALEITNGNLGIAGACEGQARFRFVDGTRSGARLQILDGTGVIYLRGGDDTVLDMNAFLDGAARPYDPRRVRLTLPGGTMIDFERGIGITRIADLNGTSAHITSQGIVHSSGKSVRFTRDELHRIAAIADPKGHALAYSYDSAGDLVRFTNQLGDPTSFAYDADHRLVEIRDALGRVSRSEYDTDGRLVAVVDPEGNRTAFVHDLDRQAAQITDRLGNATVLEYDERGNVVRRVDPLGQTSTFTYDARDNRLSETDPLGHTRTFIYDARDNLVSQTDGEGHTETVTYNDLNQPLTLVDSRGGLTTLVYDAAGNLLRETGPLGGTTTHVYDSRGNRTRTTDATGATWTYAHDSSGRVIRATTPAGQSIDTTHDANGNAIVETRRLLVGGVAELVSTAFTYDALNRRTRIVNAGGAVHHASYTATGHMATTTDAAAGVTTFGYDDQDRLVDVVYPDGMRETTAYDAEGRRVSHTDRGGLTRRYAYDALGRLTETTFPDGATSASVYDAASREIATIDEMGRVTSFTYDANGKRTSTRDPLGAMTTNTYDEAGNLTAVTDRNGHVTTYVYDAENRLVRTIYPDGTSMAEAYDGEGRQISQTDPAGNITRFDYDSRGALTRVIDAVGGVTQYQSNELDKRVAQTDALGRTTRFAYDRLGRLIQTTLPLGQIETRVYDVAGRLVSVRDYNGSLTTYTYDAMFRLATRVLPDGEVHRFTYSPTGLVASVTDATGTTSLEYDQRDRPTVVRRPDGAEIRYTYDATGNRTRVTTPGGTVAYAYDPANRLIELTDAHGQRSTFEYDPAGNLTGIGYANGVVGRYQYDTVNRLTDLTHAIGTTTLRSFQYSLGPVGNRTKILENTGRTVDYTYDALFRLTGETNTEPGQAPQVVTYAYDPVGNRIRRTGPNGTVTSTYDANNRLTESGAETFTYDDNGNLLRSSGVTGTTTYQYDVLNRLVSSASSGSLTAYTYNAFGHRIRKSDASGITDYLVDPFGAGNLSQVLRETSAAGAVDYVHGGGMLITMHRPSGTSFYLHDARGSTRLLTDAAGTVTDRYDFDAFGNMIARQGTTPNEYLFAAQRLDPQLRFYDLRARHYDPLAGRFTTRDPIDGIPFDPGSLHPYTYAHNDPVNRSDPSGEFTLAETMAVSAGVGVLAGLAYSVENYYYYRSVDLAFEAGVDAAFSFASLTMDLMGVGSLFRAVGRELVSAVRTVFGNRTLVAQTADNAVKTIAQRTEEVFEKVLCRTNNMRRCFIVTPYEAGLDAARAAEIEAALNAIRRGAVPTMEQWIRRLPADTIRDAARVIVVGVETGVKQVSKLGLKRRPPDSLPR